jgi:hypothetical protein
MVEIIFTTLVPVVFVMEGFDAAVAVDVLFKNLVHPAAMLATVMALGGSGLLAQEAILLAAIPSAVITTMFAEEYGVLASESSPLRVPYV